MSRTVSKWKPGMPITSYEDALKYLGWRKPYFRYMSEGAIAKVKCSTIVHALNKGESFSIGERIHVSCLAMCELNRIEDEGFKGLEKIKLANGRIFAIVCTNQLGTYLNFGYHPAQNSFAFKYREIAMYFANNFQRLFFDALYRDLFKYEWINDE